MSEGPLSPLGALTLQGPELRARYERDGFLVLPGAFSAADCQELLGRAAAIVEEFEPQSLGEVLSVFSTAEQAQTTDDYFLGSGDQIRFFFEPSCLAAGGRLTRPKHLALNKIGHALHELDPVFARHSRSPLLGAVLRALGLQAPLLLQSMYIFKVPDLGGEVVSHQDATFLYTDPITCTGLWLALEDATVENGCLWAQPGGHRTSLRRRFLRTPQPLEGASGPTPRTTFAVYDQAPFAEEQMVPLEVAAGTLVVLHGLLPHRSGANLSPRSRHAYSLHVVEAGAHYPADNWLQRPADRPPRQIF
ncbi:MAG TPA: phytanoyl-CoA dioxygenase family protein [Pseudomonadota bacterium]|nr:phytanoyl-CoA dioxygenase family protein [Pseudomonadota bacterium]